VGLVILYFKVRYLGVDLNEKVDKKAEPFWNIITIFGILVGLLMVGGMIWLFIKSWLSMS